MGCISMIWMEKERKIEIDIPDVFQRYIPFEIGETPAYSLQISNQEGIILYRIEQKEAGVISHDIYISISISTIISSNNLLVLH